MAPNRNTLLIFALFPIILLPGCNKYQPENYFKSIEQVTLAKAILNQNTDEISNLINGGTEIDTRGKNGMTPLMWALLNQKEKSYEFLLKNGADPNIQMNDGDWNGQSTTSLSAMSKYPWYLETALMYGGEPNLVNPRKNRTPIFEAIDYKDQSWKKKDPSMEKVLLLIKANADLNFQDNYGWTPMMKAAIANRYDIVYTLIENGADPFLETSTGGTILSLINKIRTDPQSELYKWRSKVIEKINSITPKQAN
jgi:ankyrin repeat protein